MATHPGKPAVNHLRAGELRRKELIEAARYVYEQKGIERSSVKDITDHLYVTRSLFYHYFVDKDDITEWVLLTYVRDFVKLAQRWNERRARGDVRTAVSQCTRLFRQAVFDDNPLRAEIAGPARADRYLNFTFRCTEEVTRFCLCEVIPEYRRLHPFELAHPYETVYLLLFGLVGLIRRYPDTPDDVIADIVIATLRLEADRRGLENRLDAPPADLAWCFPTV
ncbi:MAG: TetR/AcrR family transcriptional regulator [Berryella intestinalis]|nr:TetR/AcrR family transcriptional regulator [Berryella intestinalis]